MSVLLPRLPGHTWAATAALRGAGAAERRGEKIALLLSPSPPAPRPRRARSIPRPPPAGLGAQKATGEALRPFPARSILGTLPLRGRDAPGIPEGSGTPETEPGSLEQQRQSVAVRWVSVPAVCPVARRDSAGLSRPRRAGQSLAPSWALLPPEHRRSAEGQRGRSRGTRAAPNSCRTAASSCATAVSSCAGGGARPRFSLCFHKSIVSPSKNTSAGHRQVRHHRGHHF